MSSFEVKNTKEYKEGQIAFNNGDGPYNPYMQSIINVDMSRKIKKMCWNAGYMNRFVQEEQPKTGEPT